jgi:hypothetical protein
MNEAADGSLYMRPWAMFTRWKESRTDKIMKLKLNVFIFPIFSFNDYAGICSRRLQPAAFNDRNLKVAATETVFLLSRNPQPVTRILSLYLRTPQPITLNPKYRSQLKVTFHELAISPL